jgi:hypothetical protein
MQPQATIEYQIRAGWSWYRDVDNLAEAIAWVDKRAADPEASYRRDPLMDPPQVFAFTQKGYVLIYDPVPDEDRAQRRGG